MLLNSDMEVSRSRAARAWRVARAEGARGIARRVLERKEKYFGWVYGYLVTYDLRRENPVRHSAGDLRVERISDPADPAVLEILPYFIDHFSEERLRERLGSGETCFYARVDGRAVGGMWVQLGGPVVEFQRRLFTLRPGEVYYKDIFVDPALRGLGIAPALIEATRCAMNGEGIHQALSFIRWRNHASIHASRKMGGRRGGAIGYLRLFGRRFPYFFRYPNILRL